MKSRYSTAAADDQYRDAAASRNRSSASNATFEASVFAAASITPSWIVRLSRQMERLVDLPRNWNSYGSERIGQPIAEAALTLLHEISTKNTPMPSVVPTNDGKIQIEWHVYGIDLEVKVESRTKVVYCLEDAQGDLAPVDERLLTYNLTDLRRAVMRLTARARMVEA